MCDSQISESCPSDFTNYCPIDALSVEGRLKQPCKSRLKANKKWLSRKTKGLSSHRKQIKTAKQAGNLECDEDIANFSAANKQDDSCLDSSSDDGSNTFIDNNWLQEIPSRYVSQEELDALKGCVMRRRAVFSPSPSSSPVHSYIHQKQDIHQSTPVSTHSLPLGWKTQRIVDEGSHIRQGSFEYDHLKDFDPYESTVNIPNSVSVQFKFQGYEEKEVYNGGTHDTCKHTTDRRNSTAGNDTILSFSIPERLNLDCRDNSTACQCSYRLADNSHHKNRGTLRSYSYGLQSLQEIEKHHSGACNSWPRNELCMMKGSNGKFKQERYVDVFSPMDMRSSSYVNQHYSPLHVKYSSPFFPKRQIHGGMKTSESGSNFSIYSQTTTASSLADRPHCSYSKGVDGNLFKDRTAVSFS